VGTDCKSALLGQTGGGQFYGGDGSGSFSDYFSRVIYETNQFNPIALAWDGLQANITGADRYGNELSGFEANLKIASSIPMAKVASAITGAGVKSFGTLALKSGGKSFAQYKVARGGTQTIDFIESTNAAGRPVVQRISSEFSHMFITQRVQRAYNIPNWLVNNRVNVWKLNTIQHSLIDPYRFRFLRAGIKSEVGWFNEYNWFTKFPK
jgi:hypothetical protein